MHNMSWGTGIKHCYKIDKFHKITYQINQFSQRNITVMKINGDYELITIKSELFAAWSDFYVIYHQAITTKDVLIKKNYPVDQLGNL